MSDAEVDEMCSNFADYSLSDDVFSNCEDSNDNFMPDTENISPSSENEKVKNLSCNPTQPVAQNQTIYEAKNFKLGNLRDLQEIMDFTSVFITTTKKFCQLQFLKN